jgi:hypothetical protein
VRWSPTGVPLDPVRIAAVFVGPSISATPAGVLFTGFDPDHPGPDHQRLVSWSEGGERALARITRLPYRRADFPTCGLQGIAISPLFSPELVWHANGVRVAVAASTAYVIDVFEAGRHGLSVRRPVPARRVTRAMALRQVAEHPDQ